MMADSLGLPMFPSHGPVLLAGASHMLPISRKKKKSRSRPLLACSIRRIVDGDFFRVSQAASSAGWHDSQPFMNSSMRVPDDLPPDHNLLIGEGEP